MQCVVFDLFDTLATISADEYIGAKREMARILGADEDPFREAWAATSEAGNRGEFDSVAARVVDVMSRLGLPVESGAAEQAVEVERQLQLGRCQVLPGARETLEGLKRSGYTLGLLSNSYVGADGVIERLGIGGFFDTIVLSYKVGLVKPDPEIYRLACRRLGCEPADALFVGDGNDRELDGARAAGLKTMMVQYPTSPVWATDRSTEADYTVASIGDVAGMVKGLPTPPGPERGQS
jgi:putative hydrolase of the HAD superfamily